jgi:hypothetical protein
MFRLIKKPLAEIVYVHKLEQYDVVAEIYNGNEPELTDAGVATITSPIIGQYDNATRDEQLRDIYKDINENGFPMYAIETVTLLKAYPEFNVNFKVYKNTLLTKAIFESTPKIAELVIQSQTINIDTLQNALEFINEYKILNKTQQKIKQLIINKIDSLTQYMPSAPPMPVEEDNILPSAPPMSSRWSIALMAPIGFTN